MNRRSVLSRIKRRIPGLNTKAGALLVLGIIILGSLSTLILALRPSVSQAASSSTLTFQARLLNLNGSLVPDGTYNVEFKIYDSLASGASAQSVCSLNSSTDDCWWVETRTGGNKVTVKNGYVYANLGSITAFGSSIPWDQELWITMNIGGTGTPTWDGEMTPRFKATAVPYALSAAKLQVTDTGITNSLVFATPSGSNKTLTLPNLTGTVTVAAGGSLTNNGVLYGNGTAAIQATAAGTTGQCLVATTSSAPTWGTCAGAGSGVTLQAAYDNSSSPATITTADGKNIRFTLQNTTTDQSVEISQAGTALALRVNDDGTYTDSTPFVVDDSGNTGIGLAAPTAKLHVVGSTNDNTAYALKIENSAGDDLMTIRNDSVIEGYNTSGQIAYRLSSTAGNPGGFSTRGGSFTIGIIDAGFTAGMQFRSNSSSGRTFIDGWEDVIGSGYDIQIGSSTYSNSKVSLGLASTDAAGAKLHVNSTTEQLRVGYNTTNYSSFTVGSSGALTVAQTGTGGSISLTSSLASGGTTNSAFNLKTSTDLGTSDEVLQVGDSAGDFLTILGGGATLFKNSTDSTAAFAIQKAGSTNNALTVDTSNSRTTLRSGGDIATIGSELITSQDFTNATYWTTCNAGAGGWTGTSTTATHNTGNTATCSATSSNVTVASGSTYQVTFTVASNTTATNTVTPSIGGVAGPALGANATHTVTITTTGTGALTFTPTTNFNGVISAVSVKLVTVYGSALTIQNTSASTALEVRASAGTSNIYIGNNSGQARITGDNNIGLGSGTLQNSTVGGQNVAVGYKALFQNSTGDNNTAVGFNTLRDNTTGANNSAFGLQALLANTTGSSNAALGSGALSANTTGGSNAAFGNSSLLTNTTGSLNSAFGVSALRSITTGSNNTAIGHSAGYQDPNVTAFATLGTISNATALGYGSQVQASNTLTLGGQGALAVNVGIGTTKPSNTLSVSPMQYNTGTASQSGTTITGSGTTFTTAMVGNEIVFADGSKATITAFGSTTSLTASPSQTVSGQAYRIHYTGLQVASNGNVGIGTASPGYPLDIQHSGFYAAHFQTTSTTGQTSFYMENDRGSFASYGGFLYGSSASSLGNLFGYSRADRLFMFSDGASSLGYAIGTLNAAPLTIGTNNIERIRVESGGNVGVGTSGSPASLLSVGGTTGNFQVNSSGAIVAATGVTSSGSITFSGLTADRLVATTTGGLLTNTISSANLALSVSDETGTAGNVVFSISPQFTTSVTTGSTSFDVFNANATTINAFGAATTLNIDDAATTKTIDIGGVDTSGTDTIRIATNNAAQDVISIGSSHASSTALLTGGSNSLNLSSNTATLTSGTTGIVLSSGNTSGLIRSGNQQHYAFTRTVPTTVNDEVDIGSFALTAGGGSFWISITVPSGGFSVAKEYLLPLNYNQTSSSWVIAQPISDTGAYSGQDFALDVNVTNGTALLRIRRTAGTTAGTAYVTIKQQGVNTDAFTASTSTSSVAAPSGYLSNSIFSQTGGAASLQGGLNIANSGALSIGGTSVLTSGRALQNLTGITSSGTITFSGLTADRLVTTTTGGQLTNSISSANLALSVSDETGTAGNVVFSTSPQFATSVTTASSSFDVFNAGATTVNAFGAATTLNLAASGGLTNIAGSLSLNGTQFTNNASTLNVAQGLGNFGSSGPIGTNTTTVDVDTTFSIAQTTPGIVLSLPSPTSTTAGRIVYVLNTGSTSFTMHSVTIPAGYGQIYMWNGSTWILGASGGGSAITLQAAYDGGNTLTTSDARNIAVTLANTATDSNFLVNIATSSTGRFAVQNNGTDVFGVTSTTLTSAVTSSFTAAGTALSVTNSASIGANLTVDTNTLYVDSTNDRVGIGTVAPQQKLQVAGTTQTNGLILPFGVEAVDSSVISGFTQNILSNYDLRGGTISNTVTGTATSSSSTAPVRSGQPGNAASTITGGASGGTVIYEYTGIDFSTYSHVIYRPYIQMRTGTNPTNVLVEFKDSTNAWVSHVNDSSPVFNSGLWYASSAYTATNYPLKGVRFTLTMGTGATGYLRELGVNNRNQQLGEFSLGNLNSDQTFFGQNVFKTATNSTSGFRVLDSSAAVVFNVDTTNQRVGIGTASPTGKLEIYNDVGRYGRFSSTGVLTTKLNDNSSTTTLALENTQNGTDFGTNILFNLGYGGGAAAAGTTVAGGKLAFNAEQSWTSTASTQDSYFALSTTLNGTSGEKLRVTSAGNVGIGISTPNYLLQIHNTAGSSNSLAQFTNGSTGTGSADGTYFGIGTDTNFYIFQNEANAIRLGTSATNRLSLGANGGLAVGNTYYLTDPGANNVIIEGNVGIGDTSPAALLSVGSGDLFQVNSSGAVAAATGVVSSGNIDLASLNAGGIVKAAVTTGRLSVATAGSDYENPLTFGNGLTRSVNAVSLGGSLTGNTTIAGGNSYTLNLTSALTGGARSTTLLNLSQANDVTNNNSSGLLTVTNSDTASNASSLVTFDQQGTGGLALSVSGANGIQVGATSVGLNLLAPTGGTGMSFGNITSGTGITYAGNSGSSAFTGNLIDLTNTSRNLASGTINDTGNFLRANRTNVTSGTGALTVSGALVNLSSNCNQSAGTCTDTANLLSLTQSYASASGALINASGAGTGNLATLDATNASANGVSIDVQSTSSSQYALRVTSNNGSTNGLYVRADGNVGIGTATPDNYKLAIPATGVGSGILSGWATLGGRSGSDYDSVGYNYRNTASSGSYLYQGTDTSSRLEFSAGGFKFKTAPSGSAGAAITYTDTFTVLQAGNVGINNAGAGNTLVLNKITGNNLLEIQNNGTAVGFLGSSSSVDNPIAGMTVGDLGLRVQANDLFISTDSGVNAAVVVKNGGNVGIGAVAPATSLEIAKDSGTIYKGSLRLSSSSVQYGISFLQGNGSFSNPFTTGNADTFAAGDLIDADFSGGIYNWTQAGGGLVVVGNSNGSGVGALNFEANQAVAGTTRAAIWMNAVKSNGGTSKTAIGAAENLFALGNDSSAVLTVLGNGNVGIGDTTPNSLLTVGNGDLFQVNSSGQIGSQQAPVSDYLFALAGTTGNDNSRIIDITQANNAQEDSAVINIANTANVGAFSGAGTSRTISNLQGTLTPTGSVTASSSAANLNVYGSDTTLALSGITVGSSASGSPRSYNIGNNITLSGSPTLADSSGSVGSYLYAYGIQSTVNVAPTITFGGTAFVSAAGKFANTSTTSDGGSAVKYGIDVSSTGTITSGTSAGALFAASGGTVANYGLQTSVSGSGTTNYGAFLNTSGGTTNYNLYATGTALNFFGGNVGIMGDTTPDYALAVEKAETSSYVTRLYNTSTNSAAKGLQIRVDQNAASNVLLSVDTGATPRFQVIGDGSVLVGTTTDLGAKLVVVNNIDEEILLLRQNGTQSSTQPTIKVENSGGTELFRIHGNGSSIYFGYQAGNSETSNTESVGIGYTALTAANGAYGNTIIGFNAGNEITNGADNVAIGWGALGSITTGDNSVAIGMNALQLATGDNNIAIGQGAGSSLTTGTDNIIIGRNAQASAVGATNEFRLGNGANLIMQGSSSTLALQFNGDITVGDATTDSATFNATILANNAATGTTGTTSGVGGSDVSSITLSAAGSFANGDLILVDNSGGSGQDYYTRIITGGGSTSLAVAPAVSYGTAAGFTGNATITKYNMQNVGAANTGTTFAAANRFFQGYFLGGVVTGNGSTTLSDGNLTSTGGLRLNVAGVAALKIASNGNISLGSNDTTRAVNIGDILRIEQATNGGAIEMSNGSVFHNVGFDRKIFGGSSNDLSINTGANLRLYTSSTERLRIDSTGVGIGTTAPATLLEVSKSSAAYWNMTTAGTWNNSTAPSQALTITNTNPGGYDPVLLFRQATSTGVVKTAGAIDFLGTSSWTNGTVNTQISDMLFITRDNADVLKERMRIKSDGTLQIGDNTATIGKVQITTNGGSPIANRLTYSTDGSGWKFAIGKNQSGSVTDQLTIQDNGKVGIGTTSPLAQLEVGGSASQSSGALISVRQAGGNGLEFGHTNQSGYGSTLGATFTNGFPALVFNGEIESSGNTFRTRGIMGRVIVNDVANTLLYFGRLTNTNGTGQGITSDIVIDGSGNVGFGTNSPSGVPNPGVTINPSTTNTGLIRVGGNSSLANGVSMIYFAKNGSGIADIAYNSGINGVSYNTTSDRRMKQNIQNTSTGLDALMQLNVRDFDFINDPNHARQTGFIAQELYEIFPYAVTTRGDNGTDPLAPGASAWGVDYGRVTPLLAKAIQDLKVYTDSIEARIDALEVGNYYAGGNLSVSGDASISGKLEVHGIAQLTTLKVSGKTELAELTVERIISKGDAVTATLGASTTITGYGSTISTEGNDTAGKVTYTAGAPQAATPSTPAYVLAAGEQLEVVFTEAYTAAPTVTVTPTSAAAASAKYYITQTTTGFKIVFIDAPVANGAYTFNYQVIQ